MLVFETYASTTGAANIPAMRSVRWKRLFTSDDGTFPNALFNVIVRRLSWCGRDLVADIGEELCGVDEVMLGVTGGLHEDSLHTSMCYAFLGEIVRTVEGLVPVAGVVAGRLHEIRASELRRGALV